MDADVRQLSPPPLPRHAYGEHGRPQAVGQQEVILVSQFCMWLRSFDFLSVLFRFMYSLKENILSALLKFPMEIGAAFPLFLSSVAQRLIFCAVRVHVVLKREHSEGFIEIPYGNWGSLTFVSQFCGSEVDFLCCSGSCSP